MRLPPLILSWKEKFDACSLRERLLLLIAALVVMVGGANVMLIGPIDAHRKALLQEVAALDSQIHLDTQGFEAALASDPTNTVAARVVDLQTKLKAVDSQLLAESAGMITPEHMSDAIRDVLGAKHEVVLVSLRNLPAIQLAPETTGENVPEGARPYVHRVELVLEGRYLAVLDYLRALESLPWHFYWRHLELTSSRYPVNQVRVEIGTISTERDWIGL
jgi:MSHA biogenesis protein MshJ